MDPAKYNREHSLRSNIHNAISYFAEYGYIRGTKEETIKDNQEKTRRALEIIEEVVAEYKKLI